VKKFIKSIFVKDDAIQTIKFGAAKGIRMHIDTTSKTQRVLGLDEKEIQKPFVLFAKKCAVFFDIGGSDGYYSLIYRKHNPNGVIYNFEAQERFQREQKEHFALNNFSPINHSFSKFVSDKDDSNHLKLDSIFNESGKNLLFKIDVDGGELDVLKGMVETIKNNSCYFIIETHSQQLERDCIDFLQEKGFKTKIIDTGWYRTFVPENRPIEHNRWFVASN
jgi:hypothetical protein